MTVSGIQHQTFNIQNPAPSECRAKGGEKSRQKSREVWQVREWRPMNVLTL
jgi:hypothetical protein